MNCENIKEYLGEEIGKGDGGNGKVYQHNKYPSRVIKVTPVNSSKNWLNKNNPIALAEEFEIAKKAGELGVSPKVYGEEIIIIEDRSYIEMDKIIGKTITTRKEVDEYLDEIMRKIDILKQAGIYRDDNKSENFMIGKLPHSEKVDVYIIDFGGAKYKSPDKINNDKYRIHMAICHNFDHHLGGSKYIKKSVRKIKRNKRKTNRKSYRRL
jgi:tRNA A-37 threonylcarbamoyl transferase component Bud32